jgi:hypothetical protein
MLGVVLCFVPIVFRKSPLEAGGSIKVVYLLVSGLITGGILLSLQSISSPACRAWKCWTT